MISDKVVVVGHYLPSIEISVLSVTFTALVLRLTSRTLILRRFAAWDDIFICIAFILAAGLSLTHLVGCEWTHIPSQQGVVYADETRLWTLEFVQDWLFSVGELFCKIAIIYFYKQFCEEKQSRLRTIINMSMSFFVLWSITLTVAVAVLCLTHNNVTQPKDLHRNRQIIGVTLMIMQCLTIMSDLVVFVIPIPFIWKIQEIFKRKAGIVTLMGLGMLVCIVSLLRLRLIYVLFFTGDHIIWYCYGFYLTLSLKLNLLIVCACIPFCKPILRFLFKKLTTKDKPESEDIEKATEDTKKATEDKEKEVKTMEEDNEKGTKTPPRPASPYPEPPSSPELSWPLPPSYPESGYLKHSSEKDGWQVGHFRNDSEVTLVATVVPIVLKSPLPVKTVSVRPISRGPVRLSNSSFDGDVFVDVSLYSPVFVK